MFWIIKLVAVKHCDGLNKIQMQANFVLFLLLNFYSRMFLLVKCLPRNIKFKVTRVCLSSYISNPVVYVGQFWNSQRPSKNCFKEQYPSVYIKYESKYISVSRLLEPEQCNFQFQSVVEIMSNCD